MKEPLKTFIAYAREDRVLKEQLELRLLELQKEGEVLIWSDRELVAGESWNDKIHESIDSAKMFVLLVSPDFLASNYCFNVEMRLAIERQRKDTAVVVPVVVRKCEWDETELGALQVLPTEGKAVVSEHWRDAAHGFDDVITGVRRAIAAFRTKNNPTIRWSRRIGAFEWKNELLLVGDLAIVSTRGGPGADEPPGVVGLDPTSGSIEWRVPFESGANGLAWFDGRLFAGDVTGNLRCIRPRDGTVLWTRALGEPLFSRPAKVSEDDCQAVLALGHRGLLSVLDVKSGDVLAQHRIDDRFRANLVADEHDTFVASENGRLYDIGTIGVPTSAPRIRTLEVLYADEHAQNGWSPASVYGDVALSRDGVLVPFARQTYYSRPALVSYDRRTLALRWYAEDPNGLVGSFGSIRSTPVLHEGEFLWAEPYSNLLVALDAEGRVSWTVALGKQMFPQWASVVLDPKRGAAYVGRENGRIFKVNTVARREHWSLYLGEHDLAGEVIKGSQEDPSEREATNWKNTHTAAIRATPLFDRERDRLLVGTTDGWLYCVENL